MEVVLDDGVGAGMAVGAGSYQLHPSESLEHPVGPLYPKTPELAYAQVVRNWLVWFGFGSDLLALPLLLFASSSSLIEIFEFSLIRLFNF